MKRLRASIPQGGNLPDEAWSTRHRFMVELTWFHAVLIALIGPALGYRWEMSASALVQEGTVLRTVAAGLIVAIFALVADSSRLGRIWRAAAVGAGLMSASAILVDLSGGYIELHFHFFVMLTFMALYQDWVPYLLAVLYVAIHHGVVGVLWPEHVFNHAAAFQAPVTWAAIHAFFVLWASVGSVLSWKYAEQAFGRARLVLESVDEGIVWLDRDETITFINSAAIAMLGVKGHPLVGTPINDVLRVTTADGTAYPPHASPFLVSLNSGVPCQMTNELFRRRDGTTFPVDYRSAPIVEREDVTGVVLTFLDATKRQRADTELKATLSLLAATVESTADGILVVNTAGKIVHCNRKFVAMWRIPEDVMTSGSDEQALAFVLEQLREPDAFLKKVQELYATPDAESVDRITFKDGRVFERYSQPQRIDGQSVGRVWSFRDITEKVRAEADLARQATHDALTELYNRRSFEERTQQELSRAERHGHLFAILLADLDHFKAINDLRGHHAGDAALKAVAERLREASRESDLVFRWGGDEFVVLLPETTREGAHIAAQRIRALVRAMANDTALDLDLSIGIAVYPEHGRTIDDLIRLADRALYLAKRSGEPIKIGEEDYNLSDQAVSVLFQPIMNVRSGAPIGYEALSRDPTGTLSIMKLFAKYQRIGKLGELKRLCFTAQLTKAEELGLARVFLNVDFEMLRHGVPRLKPPKTEVILEISELEALDNVDERIEIAKAWRAKGYKFAIDDFGAGFISLPFIARFIPEYIKIDRSTLLQAVSSLKFRRFMTGLVPALRTYSTEGLIIEGVETQKELQIAKRMGVFLVQGFLFGYPQELNSDAPVAPARTARTGRRPTAA